MSDTNVAMTNNTSAKVYFNPVLRFFGMFISYLFHPLFITSYVMGFLLFVHPSVFVGMEPRLKVLRFIHVFVFNALFPAFSVFLLWRLQFISSIHLRTVKERIIPYIIAMIFYWWTWNVFKHLSDVPPVVIHFLLGTFLALCGAWMCNIYFKISMHTVGVGGALMFFLLFSFNDAYTSGIYLSLALLVTGLVCTARLIVGAHTLFEIWSGLFVGLLAQWVAWQF
ncbi:MAG: hypothetical protein ABUM51_07180 [Bacteroidota bacterium]